MKHYFDFAIAPPGPIKVVIADHAGRAREDLAQDMDRLGVTVAGIDRADALLRTLTARSEPDALVLSRDLAGGSGLELLRRIRARSDVPVILTAKHAIDEIDRVLAFELGADDHLVAPVGARELLARIRAILRRGRGPRRPERLRRYCFDGWAFDQQHRRLTDPHGDVRTLSRNDVALLTAFVTAPHRILSREHLLAVTRGREDIFDRSVDVQVLRLRRKLGDDPAEPRFIRTERGVGYVFKAEVRVV